ncbi:MAG: OmpA family protein [Geminicoccaceae bacterium]
MFELRHMMRPVGSSLVVAAVTLGLTSGFNQADAGGKPSVLKSVAERNSPRAQNSDQADSSTTGPTSAEATAQIEDDVPFSELNEALTEARSRLAELTKAAEIAKVAGELREELEATKAVNQKLEAVLNQTRSKNAELQMSNEAISRQAEEAQQAAADASAEVKRLDEELVAMRWHNNQLNTSLKRAEATASEASKKLEASKGELTVQIETLASELEGKIAEVTNLNQEIDATRESAKIAEQRGADLEQRLMQGLAHAEAADAKTAKLRKDLDATVTELGSARSELNVTHESLEEMSIALAAAEQEKAVLREQFTVNREETDLLRQKLDAAQTQIKQVSASNNSLQQQVEVLRTAAGEATDAARLNLIAVNNQINEINAALATAKGSELLAPSGGPANERDVAATKGDAERGSPKVALPESDLWVPELTPARASAAGAEEQQFAAAVSKALPAQPKPKNPPAASSPLANRVVQIDADANQPSSVDPVDATTLIAGLSTERQQWAEALFADLNVQTETRGLTMTVPGTALFAVDSETIGPDAYETLARVAEVIRLYEDRQVLIVAHTDAVGDDDYNQGLSERRADLVRHYFVDQFDIQEKRLSADGQGEKRPIASNATAEGRDTNRRVEVIVLNQ